MIAPSQLSQILKEGTKHFSGVDEAVVKNIEACRELMNIVRTSMGPNGMNKMVVNHLGKTFVTHDASTIMRELEVAHPAAKMVALASDNQEKEIGDGTNFVVVFAGELLSQSMGLLRMGLHPSEIVEGYSKAGKEAMRILGEGEWIPLGDLRSKEDVTRAIRSSIASKQSGYEDFLAPLVASACVDVCPKDPRNFNVDNVRVAKVEGSSLTSTTVMRGLVLPRDAEGMVKRAEAAKIAVFTCAVDTTDTETKGTVLIHSAEELKGYSKGEEKMLEDAINEIAESGVKVLVSQHAFGELAMHFIERSGMMAVKVPSKFDTRRVARVCGASTLVRVGAPTADEVGFCDLVEVREIASRKIVVFEQNDDKANRVSTVVVRGATQSIMDDVERTVEDAVNAYKALCREPKLMPGAGATEIMLARRIQRFGEAAPGLDQYAIKAFAEALEMIPRTLAENAGMDATEVVSNLYAAQEAGNDAACVDIEAMGVGDAKELGVFDPVQTRYWGIRFAVDAALTVLRVDQIIMSRPAGGPAPRQ